MKVTCKSFYIIFMWAMDLLSQWTYHSALFIGAKRMPPSPIIHYDYAEDFVPITQLRFLAMTTHWTYQTCLMYIETLKTHSKFLAIANQTTPKQQRNASASALTKPHSLSSALSPPTPQPAWPLLSCRQSQPSPSYLCPPVTYVWSSIGSTSSLYPHLHWIH